MEVRRPQEIAGCIYLKVPGVKQALSMEQSKWPKILTMTPPRGTATCEDEHCGR